MDTKLQLNTVVTDAGEFRKFIETEVLRIVAELSEKGTAPPERIQEIAKSVLDRIKPGMTVEELYVSAVKLDDNCPELAPLVFKIMKFYEEQYEKKAIGEVSNLMKTGKYDEAQDMVKKVLMFKVTN